MYNSRFNTNHAIDSKRGEDVPAPMNLLLTRKSGVREVIGAHDRRYKYNALSVGYCISPWKLRRYVGKTYLAVAIDLLEQQSLSKSQLLGDV